jgi:putative transposase
MNTYKRHRFHPSIISYAVWVYYRFNLSFRDVEDLLAERGITVSYESIRLWCTKFGRLYARRLKKNHRGFGDTFYLDEVFIKIKGQQHCLWRAVG